MLTALCRPMPASGATYARETPSTLGFPIGWYTALGLPNDLPKIASNGMRSAMPYHSATTADEFGSYLYYAHTSGIKVWIEIPRRFVREVDTSAVQRFVGDLKSHPVVFGWYLADEPTYTTELGPLKPEDAETLYTAIKQVDPGHPVAIAFSSGENAAPFGPAMDVMMVDDYPAYAGTPEFGDLEGWTSRMTRAAEVARAETDFVPIIQGFQGWGFRLPTAAEERFMMFASLQLGATGLFFWTHDRTDQAWADQVLGPLVKPVNEMRNALSAGEQAGLVSTPRSDVRVTAFHDTATATWYVVAVHYGGGTVDASISFSGALRYKTSATLMGPEQKLSIKNGKLTQKLASYGAKVYRLR